MIFVTFDSNDDETRFCSIYDKYNKLMYKYACAILKNQQDAEDALQMGWKRVADNLKKIMANPEKTIQSYITTIIKNSAIDVYNKRENTTQFDENTDIPDESNFEKIYMSMELSNFKEAVQGLDDGYRRPLILKYIYGYSSKEIAEMLEISQTNVDTRIYRAKMIVKKELEVMERYERKQDKNKRRLF